MNNRIYSKNTLLIKKGIAILTNICHFWGVNFLWKKNNCRSILDFMMYGTSFSFYKLGVKKLKPRATAKVGHIRKR